MSKRPINEIRVGKTRAPAKTDKLTAAKIGKGELEELGKRIAVHFEKMQACETQAREKAGLELRKADDHRDTISQLLAEAKAKCDGGGFKAFKKKYCPNLGRSRLYELLAIGSGKKTLEEHRAEKRKSVAKSRGKKSTTPPVVDTSEVEPVKKTTLLETGEVITSPPADDDDPAASAEKQKAKFAALEAQETSPAPSEPSDTKSSSISAVATDQPETPKHKSANVADSAQQEFDSHLLRLVQMTGKAKAARFANTAVPSEQLLELSRFIFNVYNLKDRQEVKSVA